MNNTETGGPAFPSISYWDARYEEMRPPHTDGGMTLRQYAVIEFIAAEISREGLEGGYVKNIVAMAHEYVTELLEYGE